MPALARDAALRDRLLAAISSREGIRRVRVNPLCASLVVEYDPAVIAVVPGAPLLRTWLAGRERGEARGHRSPESRVGQVARLAPIGLALAGLALAIAGGPAALLLGAALTLASATPIAARAAHGLIQRRPVVDQLDAAAVAVLLALGQVGSAALMSSLVAIGDEVRERTARRSRNAMLAFETAYGRTAWLVRGRRRVEVPVGRLRPGDEVILYPGDLVPVDGVVTDGRGTIDQKMLTGESTPVVKDRGAEVLAGTALADGKLRVRARAVGSATRIGWIIRALAEAPVEDSRIASHANAVADRLVIPTFLLAATSFLVRRNPSQAASILIVDFATGIRVSAPTAMMATLGRAAADGILVKGGRAVERLAGIDTVLFDKTGTLTAGEPAVTRVVPIDDGFSETDVLSLAAAAEVRLRHPAAHAVVRCARERNIPIPDREHSRYLPGLGMSAQVRGQQVLVGSDRFLADHGIERPPGWRSTTLSHDGQSVVWVAADGRPIGFIAYRDEPREESRRVVAWLRTHGVADVRIVSGDDAGTARRVAGEVGIDTVHAPMMPDEKASLVRLLQAEGHAVAVIGDGVNDSPAFAAADVSVSMRHGADIARETADVVLMDSNLWGLTAAIQLARRCQQLIRQNLAIVAAPNGVAMGLGAGGFLAPAAATLLNNGSTLVAAVNGLRPLVGNGHLHGETDPGRR